MSDSLDVTRPRWYLVRDPQGRILFVPWIPFSRIAYVVPTPVQRTELERRIRRLMAWTGLVVVAASALVVVLDWSTWWSLAIPAVLFAYWHWWSRRAARAFERTHYEPPPR